MNQGDPYGKRDQFDDVRRELVHWLVEAGDDRGIDSRIWDCLLDEPELMRSARRGEMAKLFQRYGVLRKHFGQRPRRSPQEAEIGPDARSDALAEIAACAALRYEWGISGFRQRYLDDRLLPVEEIPTWVEEQARREGPPAASYLRMPLADDKSLELLIGADSVASYARLLASEAERVAADPNAEVPEQMWKAPRYLSYGAPGQRTESIAIRGDGALVELKKLASGMMGLRGHVPWSESEAVAFILSGWVPPLSKARIRTTFSHGYYKALSRLSIEVDPRLTPKEVGHLYNRMRARYMQGRDRPMDEKHLALAVFAEKTRRDGTPWSELCARWNAEHPDWAFPPRDDVVAKRFALECRTAWSRVTGEKWGHVHGMKERPATQRPKKAEPGGSQEATS